MKERQPKAMTPLRYPGGKSKVVKKVLSPLFPEFSGSFFEPFIGGGSVALWVAQMYPEKKIYINDVNEKLTNFWKVLKKSSFYLMIKLHDIRDAYDPFNIEEGKQLLIEMQEKLYDKNEKEVIRAVAYYVLNKISFSGLTEHGSISKLAYEKTFNHGNIDRLTEISSHMENFDISTMDFVRFMIRPQANDFTFLDPPYLIDSSNLYGKNGELHEGFNHEAFLESVNSLKGKWMITYNDCEWIRESYKDYKIIDQEYRYSMAFDTDDNGNKKTKMKNELIITNY